MEMGREVFGGWSLGGGGHKSMFICNLYSRCRPRFIEIFVT